MVVMYACRCKKTLQNGKSVDLIFRRQEAINKLNIECHFVILRYWHTHTKHKVEEEKRDFDRFSIILIRIAILIQPLFHAFFILRMFYEKATVRKRQCKRRRITDVRWFNFINIYIDIFLFVFFSAWDRIWLVRCLQAMCYSCRLKWKVSFNIYLEAQRMRERD